jgi:hypothetical protein
MKKWLLGLLAAITFSTFAHAQTVPPDVIVRVQSIDLAYDTFIGLRLPNASGQLVYFPNIVITIGKTAVHECIRWGKQYVNWWERFTGQWFSRATYWSQQCAAQALAQRYANRRAAQNQAVFSLAIPPRTGAVGNLPSFNPFGFVPSLISLEYLVLNSIIGQDFNIPAEGTYGQLTASPATPRTKPLESESITMQ